MASSSSLTLFHTTFSHLSPSMESISSRLKLRNSPLLKLPAISNLTVNRNARVRVRVRVKAGYTKKRMETPGAYEVIDEESGERVIVWGGDDADVDGNFSTLPLQALKPKNHEKQTLRAGKKVQGSKPASAVKDNDISTAATKKLAGGFGRLKTQKVRSLVRKASQEKRVASEQDYEEVDLDETDDDYSSDSEDVFIKGKRNVNVKSGTRDVVYDQRFGDSINSNKDLLKAVSSVPVTHSRGWSNGEPRHNFRGEPRVVKHNQKYSDSNDFFSRKSFKDLPCSKDMIDSLKAQGFVRPSHIQAMAYAPAVEGKTCIIADQSGSGKTLAYLAPVIQRLRQEEIGGISKSASKSPRAVVLVPTAELASQVLRNCRSISKHGVPFRSMVATGGFRQRTQLESLEQDLDVLIATPGRFMYLIKEGFLQLTNLRCAVLDEVDILFGDEDFEQALQSLITSSPFTVQYLFATATLPVDIYNKLVEVFPDCKVIMGPGMHRTSLGLEEVLVDCSGDEGSEKTPETAFTNKKSALLKLAEETPVFKTIVFCNKIETCRKVENALRRVDRKENKIRVLPFHAALEQEARLANMKTFLSSDRENCSQSLFLICTDRASRGIDFADVDHVVLFDFPRDPSEYVRRVGRTARGAGGKGSAFIFVVGKQVSLARRIIERNQKGHPLHEVPSSYEMV